MLENREHIGVVMNPHANPRVKSWIESAFPQDRYGRIDPRDTSRPLPEHIVVVGGDGTLQPVVRLVHASASEHTISAAGGGTANMIARSLAHAEQVISDEELKDGAIPRDARPIRIGDANGNNFLFLAGFGSNETRFSKFASELHPPEPLRWLKPYLTTWKNFADHLAHPDERLHIMDMILTGSHIRAGNKPVLDDGIFGPQLERVRVKGNSLQVMAQLGLTFLYYSMHHKFPGWFRENMKHAGSFTVKRHGDTVNFDGEDEEVDRDEAIVVRKSTKPITIFALKQAN